MSELIQSWPEMARFPKQTAKRKVDSFWIDWIDAIDQKLAAWVHDTALPAIEKHIAPAGGESQRCGYGPLYRL